jgi:16S rRNA (guanine966-N2)-methyltransferase
MARARGLRVIAGSARGRRLATPAGDVTRPMADRVRESLFSALDARDRLRDARVLDLFAGSGSLAIEALSRGAQGAVLVERDRRVADVAAANVADLGFDDRARVEVRGVPAAVAGVAPGEAPFDLVFCDPPYDLDDGNVLEILRAVTARGWTSDDALVVVHRRASPPPLPDGWESVWERKFGDTLLILVARAEPDSQPDSQLDGSTRT